MRSNNRLVSTDEHDVEALLREHFGSDGPVPTADDTPDVLQDLARMVAGEPLSAEEEAGVFTSARARRVLVEWARDAGEPAPAPPPAPTSRAWIWPSATAVALAAVLVLTVTGQWTTPTAPPIHLTPKGAPVAEPPAAPDDILHVAAEREGKRWRLRNGETVRAGDALGFFYTAESPGWLLLSHVDEAGETTALYPARGQASGQIAPGAEVPLADGAVLAQGDGCEWLVAVFTDTPLTRRDVDQALAKAAREANGCELQLDVPGARTAAIHGLTR